MQKLSKIIQEEINNGSDSVLWHGLIFNHNQVTNYSEIFTNKNETENFSDLIISERN